MDKNAYELKGVRIGRVTSIAQKIDGIRCHVDRLRKMKFVIYFATRHRGDVKVEALEIEDEVIGYVLKTGSKDRRDLAIQKEAGQDGNSPLHSINMPVARGTRVLVVCTEGEMMMMMQHRLRSSSPPCITSPSTYARRLSSRFVLPLISH